MILGSVIIAAIISPTPDVMNQMLLAGPLVAMYQAGIGMIGIQHSRRKKTPVRSIPSIAPVGIDDEIESLLHDFEKPALDKPTKQLRPIGVVHPQPVKKQIVVQEQPTFSRSVDGFRVRNQRVAVPNRTVARHLRREAVVQTPRRSLDGMLVSVRPAA